MALATCDDFGTIAGATLHISATLPATYNEAGFEALSWTEIGGITSIPSVGATYGEVSISLVKTGICKKKGTKDFGTATVEFATAISDTGQIALKTAYASQDAASFKILYQDASADYATGLVMGVPKTNGTGENASMATATIAWTGDIVETVS